ncbi:MAG: SDR family NAD(P)-dependent oxidoreductase [Nitrospina sp.]|jgi:NAD(P)-dependent dehydrogenase (short-subunit alcohol dehydrogenase family)|nr:SDR family NAD(P)-dependent oxidoreductase [Nitrospina sp.]
MSDNSKVILVIGGACGIGKATATVLLSQNYRVICADINYEKLEEIKTNYKDPFENQLFTYHLDITDQSSVSQCLSWIKSEFTSLDGIVISAAAHSAYPVEFLTNEIIDQVININLTAHIKLIRDALPIIKDGGSVIGISSIAAGLGVPMSSMYSASKAGLEGFYESMSAEVSYRNIKTILIHPGNVNTGFNETGNEYRPTGNSFVDAGYQRVVSGIDSSKGMDPNDVAKVIVSAIQTRSPKFCYVVGMNALKAHWAKRLLGRELALKLMAKYFGF